MVKEIWVNIGSGNGLLPDGTKPLPETMLTYHQWSPKTFTWKKFHERSPNHQSLKWTWKPLTKTLLKSPRGQWVKFIHVSERGLWSHLPGQCHRASLILGKWLLGLGSRHWGHKTFLIVSAVYCWNNQKCSKREDNTSKHQNCSSLGKIQGLSMQLFWVALDWSLNTLRLRQNGRRFTDDTFQHIFLNENVKISIKISLKFVPKGQINNIPALVQIMAWRRPGAKPLSETMMVRLETHICVTQPQWVNVLACHLSFFMFCFLVLSKIAENDPNDWYVIIIIRAVWDGIMPVSQHWEIRSTLPQLEQLERLRSEDIPPTQPPPPHDHPYHRVILDPKSKEDKVKVTNLKNSPKFQTKNKISKF